MRFMFVDQSIDFSSRLQNDSKVRAIERARKIDEKAFSKKHKIPFTKSLLGRVNQHLNKMLMYFTTSTRSIMYRVGKAGI